MSNLSSATQAIVDEIERAKQGAAYYQERIEKLQAFLQSLSALDGTGTQGKGRRGRPKKVIADAPPTKVTRGQKKKANVTGASAPKKSGRSKKLPFTGGDFWAKLITDKPQSNRDVLNAAVASLGIKPADAELKKLVGRMTFALNAMVAEGKIQDSGKGRERRFFKP